MIEVRRLGPQIGAEILGVDVRTLDDAGFAAIYRAWLDHNVAVVPGQELALDDFVTYSRRFGQVVPHPSKITRHPERPEVTLLGVNKFGADGALDMAIYRRGAEGWHTDGAYDEEPFKATQLYALAMPSRGGDTHFASMYAAYDALPPRLKDRLDGPQGRLHLRRPQEGDRAAQRGRPRLDPGLPPDHPHASGDRPQGALLRPGQDPLHRRARAGGERRVDRRADRAHDPARGPATRTTGARATS